jgi:hypothetical protein
MRQRALDEDVAGGRLDRDEAIDPALVAARTVPDPLGREVRDAAAAGFEPFAVERLELERQPLRQRHVVAVHAREVAASSLRTRTLERGHHPRGPLAQDAEPSIGARVRRRDLGRPVRRAVVDDEHLEVLQRLAR